MSIFLYKILLNYDIYQLLRKESEGVHKLLFEYFWKIKTLPLTQVITWQVLENNLATKDNLER